MHHCNGVTPRVTLGLSCWLAEGEPKAGRISRKTTFEPRPDGSVQSQAVLVGPQ